MKIKTITLDIAALYYGAKCKYVGKRSPWTTEGDLIHAIVGMNLVNGQGLLNMQSDSGACQWYPLGMHQLILTRISDMTSAHASKCASLCGLHTEGNTVTRTTEAILVTNDTYEMHIGYDGYICMRKNGLLFEEDMRKVIDFLHGEYYDLGKGKIKSLIDEGMAIPSKR